jgi:putative endonuclease
LWEHKNSVYPKSFSSRYKLYKLVYYEEVGSIEYAIEREKYIKGKSRDYKESLINKANPSWSDLGVEIEDW